MSKTIGDLTQNDIGKYVTVTSIVEGQRHKGFVVTGVLGYVEHGENVDTVMDRMFYQKEADEIVVARRPWTTIQVGPGYFDQIDPSARVHGIDL